MRLSTASKTCVWDIVLCDVSGSNCGWCGSTKSDASKRIAANLYSSDGSNDHWGRTLVGMCTNVPAGDYVMKVEVTTTIGTYSGGDCYSGWYGGGAVTGKGNNFYMEAFEVN